MQSMISAIFGGVQRVKAPDWMRGSSVCPIIIDDEMWWRSTEMVVKGLPPEGVGYTHPNPHFYPDTFGPTGTPVQVHPGPVDFYGRVSMVDLHGDGRVMIDKEYLALVREIAPETPSYWYYPTDDEEKKSLVVMTIVGIKDFEEGDREQYPFTFVRDGVVFAVQPLAYIRPARQSIQHFLSEEERDGLPRFDGEEIFVAGAHG